MQNISSLPLGFCVETFLILSFFSLFSVLVLHLCGMSFPLLVSSMLKFYKASCSVHFFFWYCCYFCFILSLLLESELRPFFLLCFLYYFKSEPLTSTTFYTLMMFIFLSPSQISLLTSPVPASICPSGMSTLCSPQMLQTICPN